MSFEPIAIVGEACVLPGALSSTELWQAVVGGRDLLTRVPDGRWRVRPALVAGTADGDIADRIVCDRGGFVHGFESAFNPHGFAVPETDIQSLDPLFQWVLHTARGALQSAGVDAGAPVSSGLVLANLSLPSRALVALEESLWLDAQPLPPGFRDLTGVIRPDARNRFMSGLPALLTAQALGLTAGAFSLDAACASSLYAVKIACDWLHDRRADRMLAAAVNAADSAVIHLGFSALRALSPTGRSRPFHRDADGLVPAEGAVCLVLERLDDAIAAGRRIRGVIRAVGISNDGRGAGLLTPSEAGQQRAMRAAYDSAGLEPSGISLLECHATGTSVGDACEVRSTAAVFEGCRGVPIGSLKSNLGHLVTAAGAAAILKVLKAFEAGVRPPTLHADEPLASLAGSPFRLLTAAESWTCEGPRRAAVSAFGFGGNNAHLILEEWQAGVCTAPAHFFISAAQPIAVAVVGAGCTAAASSTVAQFTEALFDGRCSLRAHGSAAASGFSEEVRLNPRELRFPPSDLQRALPQQLLVLAAALEAAAECGPLSSERTAVFVGMQCDGAAPRYVRRVHLSEWAARWSGATDSQAVAEWLTRAREALTWAADAPAVVGMLSNIPANRLNSHFDLTGPGFTVSAEELSGVVALELAVRGLRSGEFDAAIVGAVDVSAEPVQTFAVGHVLDEERAVAGDAAVVLVLKRADTARREGTRILAEVEIAAPEDASSENHARTLGVGHPGFSLAPAFGHAHAAAGLLHVLAGVLASRHGAWPGPPGQRAQPWLPFTPPRAATVIVNGMAGASVGVRVQAARDAATAPMLLGAPIRFRVFSGADVAAISDAVRRDVESDAGPARLVVLDDDSQDVRAKAVVALERLGRQPAGSWMDASAGVFFRASAVRGDVAFTFTGPAGAYRGMGSDLLLAFPEFGDALAARFQLTSDAWAWIYDRDNRDGLSSSAKLWGASWLSQAHAELTRAVLRLLPQAAIGYSSGESNALLALGAWRDVEPLYAGIEERLVYARELAGDFHAVKRAWSDARPVDWATWSVRSPIDEVRAALDPEARAHLTIINTRDDVVIAGDARACERAIGRLGRQRTRRLGYNMAIHCPEVLAFADEWRQIHTLPTFPVPGVRFYTHASLDHYQPTSETAAASLLGQAVGTIDFPRLVEKAWEDGVRVFIEHGPQDACSRWLSAILGDRDHVAVALDAAGTSSVWQAASAVAQLVAAGVPVDYGAFEARLSGGPGRSRAAASSSGLTLRLAVHSAWQALPPFPRTDAPGVAAGTSPGDALAQVMPSPPLLPCIDEAEPSADTDAGHDEQPGPIDRDADHARPVHASMLASSVHALVLAQSRHAAVAHRTFVAQQSAVHQRFLQGRAAVATRAQAGVATRLRAAAGVGTTRSPSLDPVPAAEATPPTERRTVAFSRQQLEALASGRISSVFGPMFAGQDHYLRQVRLPEPPLLLVDRVTGLDAVPASMGLGRILTETDVRHDSWYLHEGRMPFMLMVEAGQADLLLISWLGIDQHNQGERVYRLLGCDVTYHGGGLPRPGDTLAYDIAIDRHSRQGDARLFSFGFDCRIGGVLRLSVRNAQAGFFSDRELAQSGGLVGDLSGTVVEPARIDPPRVPAVRRSFTASEVSAFAAGRVPDCFGAGYEWAATHVRTPRIPVARMQLLHEVTDLDPAGGPARRGYLRAITHVSPDDWFFEGHFKNDPCMAGTLMVEGCLQALAFYLSALGHTLENDGWVFEPVPGHTSSIRCRGQVTPRSRELVYELFIHELVGGPTPTIYADCVMTVDGLRAVHCRRLGIRLSPEWPLTSRPDLIAPGADPRAAVVWDVPLDSNALLACAWGKPSDASGEFLRAFDGVRRAPRLPAPPFLFVTRITHVAGVLGGLRAGLSMTCEYDIPPDAWYFAENGSAVMPFAVLLEANLQPCGWLAVASGVTRASAEDLRFRNLDGSATVHRLVRPQDGALRSDVELISLSRSGSVTLVSFRARCFAGADLVFEMKTGFGFFARADLANQVGLPTGPDERALLTCASERAIDLRSRLPRYFAAAPRLAGPMLLMLDRITGYWPAAGRAGLGRLRAEKTIAPGEWFFKAHFFQDPVQPGSLGLEAMIQLVQFYMLERDLAAGIEQPVFEPLALDGALSWKYRGQVLPTSTSVVVEAEITAVGRDARGPYAIADAWLWVDGTRIYSASALGVRIVSGIEVVEAEETIDPAFARWVLDHRPTYTVPALPFMWLVDRIAAAALAARPAMLVVGLTDVEVRRWVTVDRGAVRFKTRVVFDGDRAMVTLLAWRNAQRSALSRFEPVLTGTVVLADSYPSSPASIPRLESAGPAPDPYASGALFHGPAFQVLRQLFVGDGGAAAVLDAGGGGVPDGILNPALLDGSLHAIPHDDLSTWCGDIAAGEAAYPTRIISARFYARTPVRGDVRCEVRFDGFEERSRSPRFHVQLIAGGEVWADYRVAETLFPKGRLGSASPQARRAFLQEKRFVPGVRISVRDGERTRMSVADVKLHDWLAGTVASAYDVSGDPETVTRLIAIKDHVAHQAGVHPAAVRLVTQDPAVASCAETPLTSRPLKVVCTSHDCVVEDAGPEFLDLSAVRDYWRESLHVSALGPANRAGDLGPVNQAGASAVEDLFEGLCASFVRAVRLRAPEELRHAGERGGLIFLANHQCGIESLAFLLLVSTIVRRRTMALAKAEHRESWLGKLLALSAAYPGMVDPDMTVYFQRSDERSLLDIVNRLRPKLADRSRAILVHVEGTRALSCRRAPATHMSSVWIDLAAASNSAIVPVRFSGALPVEPVETRLEFPLGYGTQDYDVGAPLLAADLLGLPLVERTRYVIDAINALGPSAGSETPHPPRPDFADAVARWRARTGTSQQAAAVWCSLAAVPFPSSETMALLAGAHEGRLTLRESGDGRARWLAGLAAWLYGDTGPVVALEED